MIKTTNQVTVGQLLTALSSMPADSPVFARVGRKTEAIVPGVHSYRGFYEDLAIPTLLGGEPLTVAGLMAELRTAIGRTFCGWKGGEYLSTKDTAVWIAKRGNSGHAVTGVKMSRKRHVLLTWEVRE